VKKFRISVTVPKNGGVQGPPDQQAVNCRDYIKEHGQMVDFGTLSKGVV
jgi:hypothetical protein